MFAYTHHARLNITSLAFIVQGKVALRHTAPFARESECHSVATEHTLLHMLGGRRYFFLPVNMRFIFAFNFAVPLGFSIEEGCAQPGVPFAAWMGADALVLCGATWTAVACSGFALCMTLQC